MSINRWLYWSKKTYALATIAGTESLLGSSAAFSMCCGFPHCLYFVGSFNDENQHIVVVDESICCCRWVCWQSQRWKSTYPTGKPTWLQKYMLLVIHNIWLVSPVLRFVFCNYPDQRNNGSNGRCALELLILVSVAGAYASTYCLLTYRL